MRDDSAGLFWHDVQERAKTVSYDRPIPAIPDTGWVAPAPDTWPRLSDAMCLGLDLETKDTALREEGPGFRREGDTHAHIVGIAVGTPEGGRWYMPMRHSVAPEQNLNPDAVLAWARDNLCTPGQVKIGANIGYDVDGLWSEGVPVTGPFIDVQHAEALLNPNRFTYNLEALGSSYLDEGKVSAALEHWVNKAYGDIGNYRAHIHAAPPCLVGPYAEGDVDLPLRIWSKQKPLLEQQFMLGLFDLETELIPLMIQMRHRGVRVDVEYAKRLYDELTVGMAELDAKLKAVAGRPIDVDVKTDLQALFDAAGVAYPRTAATKNFPNGQASFVKEWLEHVDHPAGELIRQRRQLQKYRDTFVNGYILDKHINGRIYALFHQLKGDDNGAVSGRFSCVHADAQVATKRGMVAAKNVIVGDQLWTHKARWKPVTHLWRKGLDQMYDVVLSNGEALRCTAQHRLLTVHHGWKTVGELNDLKQVAICTAQQSTSDRLLPGCGAATNTPGNWPVAGHHVPDNYACGQTRSNEFRTQSLGSIALFGFQRGAQEPNAWQETGAAPKLERGVLGQSRLLNHQDGTRPGVRASRSGGGDGGRAGVAGQPGTTPYRREPGEQPPGQYCGSNAQGACNDPQPGTSGIQAIEVYSINPCGCFEVYDFTVKDDESYLAHGVFNHNSSQPNLQNIPARDKYWGPKLRALFIPEEDEEWMRHDWSQIEYRFLGHYARGPSGATVRKMYNENPDTDFHEMVMDMVAPEVGWDVSTPTEREFRRRPIKNINFGLCYGMGVGKLTNDLGLSDTAGERLFKGYHRAVPFVKDTAEAASLTARNRGYIVTIGGRRAKFELYEPKWGQANKGKALPYTQAVEAYGSNVVRAYTHKALNALLQGSAADLMKEAMRQRARSGVDRIIGVPLLTCHDELGDSVGRTKAQREAANEVKHIMENCMKLRVPVIAEQSFGSNWGKAK